MGMMEFYELTVLQLDAIGRVCDYATENESEYIRFVESEIKGEHNWDRDLTMLSVLHDNIRDLYKLRRYNDNRPFIVNFHWADEIKAALGNALSFYLAKNMAIRDETASLIVMQNFPEFDKRVRHEMSYDFYYTIPERTYKYVPDPV
jgi:hypothetical protein